MPAADLSRLREQLRLLMLRSGDPQDFTRALLALCEEYYDPSFRLGPNSVSVSLLPAFRLAPLIQRHFELMLSDLVSSQPTQALEIARRLWEEPWLETHRFAALILGELPISQAELVLELLREWILQEKDAYLLDLLLNLGTRRLRHEGADVLLEMYSEWLLGVNTDQHRAGLLGLHSLVSDPGFENLPPLFTALFPLYRSVPAALVHELTAILTSLAERTPTECAYFLRQVLASPVSRETPRLIRRVLPLLSEEQQAILRRRMVEISPNREL